MKTIAVDVDDVLAINVPAFVKFSNDKWGTRLKMYDYDENWAKIWGVDHAEVEQRNKQLVKSEFVASLDEVPHAKNVLDKLSQSYKLVITTSRRKELEALTSEWIEKYFGDIFEEVHFAGMWDKITKDSHKATKAELCKQIGADYLIDDHPKHCFAAAYAGIPSLLFGDYSWYDYNQEFPDGVNRAQNWHEVAEYFDV